MKPENAVLSHSNAMPQEALWALIGAGIGGTGGYGLGKLLKPDDELAAILMGLGGAGTGAGLGYGSAKVKQEWDAAPDAPPDIAKAIAESGARAKALGEKAQESAKSKEQAK